MDLQDPQQLSSSLGVEGLVSAGVKGREATEVHTTYATLPLTVPLLTAEIPSHWYRPACSVGSMPDTVRRKSARELVNSNQGYTHRRRGLPISDIIAYLRAKAT